MTCTIHVLYMRHQYCVVGYLLLDGEWTTMNKVSNQFHSTRQFIGLSLLPDSTNVANLKNPGVVFYQLQTPQPIAANFMT